MSAASAPSASPTKAPAKAGRKKAEPATTAPAKTATTEAAKPVTQEPTPDGAKALELYFLRHADAGDPAEWAGDDADRPLSKKGRRQSRRLGKLFDDLGFEPDLVLTSPKLRAADTAKLAARRLDAAVTIEQRLAGGLDGEGIGELVGGLDRDVSRVVLVGHDPEFSELVSWLVGSPIALRKGALARVDLPDRRVGSGIGSLRWLLPPDAVPD